MQHSSTASALSSAMLNLVCAPDGALVSKKGNNGRSQKSQNVSGIAGSRDLVEFHEETRKAVEVVGGRTGREECQ